MRRLQSDNYKKLIPLKSIAEISSYSFGYVSILVQRKKLKAKKIGNKYYSTQEWFNQYLELHARDGKKLSSEAAQKLLSGKTPDEFEPADEYPSLIKRKSEINNFIDNIVEQLDRKKFKAHRAPELNDLEQILNYKIILPEAEFVADFVEPEIRLKIKWQKIINQEIKDFLKQKRRQRIEQFFEFKPLAFKTAVIVLIIFLTISAVSFNQKTKPALKIFRAKIISFSENTSAIFTKDTGGGERKGRVAGALEVYSLDSSPILRFKQTVISRYTVLVNIALLRGREAMDQVKNNTIAVLENMAGRQKELSLSFAGKLEKIIK